MLYKIIVVLFFVQLASAFSFDAYSETNYQGTYTRYDNFGTYSPGYTIRSYHWNSEEGDGCCVKMCDGSREVGYWCEAHDHDDSNFNKIVMGCGNDRLEC